MAYPELVSRGVSKTRTFKWLVKVGASIYQTPDLKNNVGWGGGFRATKKPPWIRHCRPAIHGQRNRRKEGVSLSWLGAHRPCNSDNLSGEAVGGWACARARASVCVRVCVCACVRA